MWLIVSAFIYGEVRELMCVVCVDVHVNIRIDDTFFMHTLWLSAAVVERCLYDVTHHLAQLRRRRHWSALLHVLRRSLCHGVEKTGDPVYSILFWYDHTHAYIAVSCRILSATRLSFFVLVQLIDSMCCLPAIAEDELVNEGEQCSNISSLTVQVTIDLHVIGLTQRR